jgi:hypothetical protein
MNTNYHNQREDARDQGWTPRKRQTTGRARIILIAVAAFVVAIQGAAAKLTVEPFPMDATGHVVFTGVVQVEGATAAELFSRAQLWAAKTREGVRNVVKVNDPASGLLIITTHLVYTGNFARTTIEVKDGRYRWTIDQLLAGPDRADAPPYEILLTKERVGSNAWGRRSMCEGDRRMLLAVAAELQTVMTTAPGKW